MKTFVIAMDNEAESLVARLSGVKESRLWGRRAIEGFLEGEEVLAIVSGIGKTNAASAAQLAIQHTGAKTLYNIGVAGGLEETMKVGDLYEVSRSVQYDFDLVAVNGGEMGTLNERDTPYFDCATTGAYPAKILGSGDRFNDDEKDYLLLRRLGAGLRDMEGAAIAHVCEKCGAGFMSLKCVSDVHGAGSTPGQYLENLKKCLAILSSCRWPV